VPCYTRICTLINIRNLILSRARQVGILLHLIETFPGVVVVITNLKDRIDSAFLRRMKFVLEFPLPDEAQRQELWKLILPAEAPRSADVDFAQLARRCVLGGGGNDCGRECLA
jgi:SpoVK/Ycf46/Vps4 family AAA+-type ATPase